MEKSYELAAKYMGQNAAGTEESHRRPYGSGASGLEGGGSFSQMGASGQRNTSGYVVG